jgi:hypothetical protein
VQSVGLRGWHSSCFFSSEVKGTPNVFVNDMESTTMNHLENTTTNPQTITMSPLELARLDFQLFKSLRQLGTSPERIESVLNLKPGQFDYVQQLSAG